ncbi:hypothetical protein N9489_03035 [Methylophilaceae bacterium]|nr:hypothetical protein [Methylophilaceae bacterium]
MANENNAKQWRYFNVAVFIAIAYLSFLHEGPTWSGTFYETANGFTKVGFQEFFGFLFVYLGFTALVSYCAFWSIMSSLQKNILNIIVALGFIPVGVYIIFQELVTDIPLLAEMFYPFVIAALLYGNSSDAKNRVILKSGKALIKSGTHKKSLMDDFATAAKVKGGKPNKTSLNQSIKMAHEQLLGKIIPKAKVAAIAKKLNDGPMSYSHDDLAFSVALNFFKNKDYIKSLATQQLMARLALNESLGKENVNPLLAVAFENALYKLYK